ncbi:MAG: asparaginase domain-containing protein [bacterium]|nr:asparaginase domain-containing protein [bacterium]
MSVLFIQTGGTIDKEYPKVLASYSFEISKPAVTKYLKKFQPNFRYRVVELMKKDSLDITAQDRERIYEACLSAKEKKIIITHGTDTMVATASVLHKIKGKVIVLTGALLPAIHVDSDAAFNLGTAVGAIDVLTEGVYIAMSGRVYPWDACKKSHKTLKFVSA